MPVPDVPGQASSEHRNSDRFRGQDKCWDNDNQTGLRRRRAPWAGRRLQTPYVRTVGCSYPRSVHPPALPGRGVDKGRGKARASSGRGVESKRWSALISTRRRGTIRRIRTKSRRDRRAVVIQRGRVLTDARDLGLCVHVDVALDSGGRPLNVPTTRWKVVDVHRIGDRDLASPGSRDRLREAFLSLDEPEHRDGPGALQGGGGLDEALLGPLVERVQARVDVGQPDLSPAREGRAGRGQVLKGVGEV